MILDVLHELAVLEAFFARQAAWITTGYAKLGSADGASRRSSEQVEHELFHPEGPGAVEDLTCRVVINELNALVEALLQGKLSDFAGFILATETAKADIVYSLPRRKLEERLTAFINLTTLPGHAEIEAIREIAEGNKHRERLRPVPTWDKATKSLVERHSLVPGLKGESAFEPYDIALNQVSAYLAQARVFVHALLTAPPSAA